MSKKSNKTKCGPGEILRKGYKRKGYHRNEFTRQDGTVVPASYIPESTVPPTCVPDFGKVGRGKKVLPPLDDKLHLSTYGYSIHKSEPLRRAALRAAAKDNDILMVLRRLSLIRNYQPIPENKEIFTRDVEFMKDMYDPYRKTPRRAPEYKVWENENDLDRWRNMNNRKNYRSKNSSKSNRRTKTKRNQRGGDDEQTFIDPITPIEFDDSTISDDVVDNINLPEQHIIEINTVIDRKKVCDSKGNCIDSNNIYEMHEVDGKQVLYYTLDKKDANDVLKLDLLFLDTDRTSDDVIQNIQSNPGLLIGIKIDGKLEGYCQYKPQGNMDVKIVWFCANKGFGTALYVFMEKYFRINNYVRIILVVSLEGPYATKYINFWYHNGFMTYETIAEKKKVYMEKFI